VVVIVVMVMRVAVVVVLMCVIVRVRMIAVMPMASLVPVGVPVVFPATRRTVLMSVQRPTSRRFPLFKTFLIGMTDVTHSGFLDRFVV
jgi:hypothetical protein